MKMNEQSPAKTPNDDMKIITIMTTTTALTRV